MGGVGLEQIQIGKTVVMKDWSNLMLGKEAKCSTCGCMMAFHGHQLFTWKKIIETRSIINEDMKREFDKYKSEEEQNRIALEKFEQQLNELRKVEAECKEKLKRAMHTFKEKSTATSYVRVLQSQVEYLDFVMELVKGDSKIRSDVRDAR